MASMILDWAMSHGQWLAPAEFSQLRNLYWSVRAARNGSDRRAAYRRAEREKDRLLQSGIDSELLRLACRHFKDPSDKARALRVAERHESLVECVQEEFTGRQVWASMR